MSYAFAAFLIGLAVWLFLAALDLFHVQDVQSVENDADENTATPEEIVEVSVEDFDNYFDRSAGRYCEHCGIHGSHRCYDRNTCV